MNQLKNENKDFDNKWGGLIKNKSKEKDEEFSIFVRLGQRPKTQRQFNLFHYFEYIKTLVEKYNVKNCLEVGCGRGTMSLYLNKHLGLQSSLADRSAEAIELAKKNFAKFDAQGEFRNDDAEHLSFEDNIFDMVVSIGLVEHLEDYSKIYAEKLRVLKPGGVMVSLNIPHKFSVQILNKIYRWFLKLFGRELKKDYYRNTDTPRDYKRTAEKVGFQDIETFYVNPFPLFTPVPFFIERLITICHSCKYRIRGMFMKYPFRSNSVCSQAHFLIARKK
ncbi:class I SAM-dependent methyltransferase [bacterium]|nr:class I SAM-dependent methyltransferase [bacterium]